jgi:hypothetical protein
MKNDDLDNPEDLSPQPSSAPSLESETAELLKDWTPATTKTQTPTETTPQDTETIDDTATDEAVADIVAHESDEILAIEDAVNEVQNEPEPKPSVRKRLKNWLTSSKGRWSIGATVATLIVVSIIVPSIRYFILNTVGVRATSSVTVLDISTQQPLKNTRVQIGTAEGITDSEGAVSLGGIRLGKQRFVVDKLAFSSVDKSITVGWGSNPQGTIELTPTGAQYEFRVTDVLTTKPVAKVELTSGQSNARTDDDGKAVLTIEEPGEQSFEVRFDASNYRVDTISIDPATTKATEAELAPDARHVFVSKRSGKYDMYSVYADGKQQTPLLKATGSERDDDMTIVPNPSGDTVAYVSTRANQTNVDGYLLSGLLLINTLSQETTPVVTAEQISIVGWAGERLVYIQISEGQSAASNQRYRLMSYDIGTNENKQLASADYINDVRLFGGQIFYALGGGLQPDKAKLYRTNPDGSNTQTLLDQEVWSIVRVSVDELAINTSDQRWHTYSQGAAELEPRDGSPGDTTSRVYIDSPDGKRTAWIDERDGKGVVLVYDFATKTEEAIVATAGIDYPLRWLTNSAIVYRFVSPTETADFVVEASQKQPRKLIDVTPTKGLGTRR